MTSFSQFTRVIESNGANPGAIFGQELNSIRESGVSNQPCVAHIHFTATKMLENELSGQYLSNNSGYSLPSESMEQDINVRLEFKRFKLFSQIIYTKLF